LPLSASTRPVVAARAAAPVVGVTQIEPKDARRFEYAMNLRENINQPLNIFCDGLLSADLFRVVRVGAEPEVWRGSYHRIN